MQKLFEEVASLDDRCYKEFYLSEDILMEHAASGMAEYIRNNFKKMQKLRLFVEAEITEPMVWLLEGFCMVTLT